MQKLNRKILKEPERTGKERRRNPKAKERLKRREIGAWESKVCERILAVRLTIKTESI